MTDDFRDSEQSEANTQLPSQYDNNGPETFYDFVMRNIKEVNKEMSNRHDLSKPKDGYVLFTREMTPSQASYATSEKFINSMTKGKKNKVWEYFVFVPEFSDSLLTPTAEQIAVFNQLRKSQIDAVKGNKLTESPNKDIFEEEFEDEEREIFLKKMYIRLISCFRFYGTKSNPGIGIRNCKVSFHDKNNFQFGKMQEILGELGTDSIVDLRQSIGRVKRQLGIKKMKNNANSKSLHESVGMPDPTQFLRDLEQADMEAYETEELDRILSSTDDSEGNN